ncbi:hypothetical protein [Streptomyces sp. HNM1019]
MAVLEPTKTAQEDVAKLRSAPELASHRQHGVGVYAYDLATGMVTTVVE